MQKGMETLFPLCARVGNQIKRFNQYFYTRKLQNRGVGSQNEHTQSQNKDPEFIPKNFPAQKSGKIHRIILWVSMKSTSENTRISNSDICSNQLSYSNFLKFLGEPFLHSSQKYHDSMEDNVMHNTGKFGVSPAINLIVKSYRFRANLLHLKQQK